MSPVIASNSNMILQSSALWQDKTGYNSAVPDIKFKPLTPEEKPVISSPFDLKNVFSNNSLWTYLPLMRSASYICEAFYKPVQYMLHRYDKTTGGKIYEAHRNFSLLTYPDYRETTSIKNPISDTTLSHHDAYLGVINKVESLVFCSLAAACLTKEYQNFKNNSAYAVGIEMGKNTSDITLDDLRASKNPLIQTELQRFYWKAAIRMGSGASFTLGLAPGIIGNSLAILSERSLFSAPKAYNMIMSIVGEYNQASAGEEAVPSLVFRLKNIYQQVRQEEKKPPLNHEQMTKLSGFFESLAKDIVAQRIGGSGVLYVMGGGVMSADNPERTMNNYNYIMQVAGGVAGVQQEAVFLKNTTGLPGTRIWEAQHLAQEVSGKFKNSTPSIAPSARVDVLQSRNSILDKGYVATLTQSDASQLRNLAIN